MRASVQLILLPFLFLGCEPSSTQAPAPDVGLRSDAGTPSTDGGVQVNVDAGEGMDANEGMDAGDAGSMDASDAGSTDAGSTDAGDAGSMDAGDAGGRCRVEPNEISCAHNESYVPAAGSRRLFWQVPLGVPPTGGWPVVLLFHGSFVVPEASWAAQRGDSLGFYWQTRTIWRLLEAGYAVLTPEAQIGPSRAWNTNILPWSANWVASPDHQFMLDIFEAVNQGDFGPLDSQNMYATGISSGGYMTSRMAIAYPGRFRGLAIQSASYATCAGALCQVPELPADHPPTLFLHGQLDPVVPISTAQTYYDALDGQGTAVELLVDPSAGHQWIEAAPESILQWFQTH